MVGKFANLTASQVEAIYDDPSLTLLERCVLKILEKAATDGDPRYLNFLTDQLYGKLPVPKEVDLRVSNPPTIVRCLDGSTIKLGRTLDAEVVEQIED